MPNRNKRIGTEHESAVTRYLNANDVPAHRVAQTGPQDSGDIWLPDHGVLLQAKNWGNVTDALNEGVKGAQAQARVAGFPYAFAVVKRRGKGVAQAYVVTDLETFARMLADGATTR